MAVSLFFIVPGMNQAVVIKEGLVTWARAGEVGLDLTRRMS